MSSEQQGEEAASLERDHSTSSLDGSDTILKLADLLASRDPSEPIESFLRRWAPVAYGLRGALGTITMDAWPVFKDMPLHLMAKVVLVNVMTYKVGDVFIPHVFMYTSEKKTYYVGTAPAFGTEAVATAPRQIHELDDVAIVAIQMGPDYDFPNAYMHLQDGTIWSVGDNIFGHLGNGKVCPHCTTFEPVVGLQNVILFQCGSGSCCALDVQGKVWVFGSNDFGEIAADPLGGIYTIPQEITSIPDIKPVFLASSFAHIVVVGADNEAYSFGDNQYCQLGRESEGPSTIPGPIPCLNSSKIIKISCGAAHNLCLQESELLLGWGENMHGEICVGNSEDISAPATIRVDGKKVIDILATEWTSLALTDDDQCFLWGSLDGENILEPCALTAKHPRDLLANGDSMITGGCVQLDIEPLKWTVYLSEVNKDLQGRVEGLEQENIELKKKNLELEQKIQELERKNEALSNELGAKNQEMALQIVMKLPPTPPVVSTVTEELTGAAPVQVAVSPREKRILITNYRFLVNHLPHEEVKEHLLQREIINFNQLEEIDSKRTTREKCEKILKYVLRHRDGYKVLIEALQHPENHSCWIADQLNSTDTS